MYFRRFLFVTFLLFTGLLPSAIAQDQQVTHIVQPGENLFRIALRYGVQLDELSSVNGIDDARNIYSGQELVIPGLTLPAVEGETLESTVVENPLVASPPIIHVVQRGEILSRIADEYSVTVEAIMQANAITNPSRILAGEELQIWAPHLADTVNSVEEVVEAIEVTTTDDSSAITETGIIPTPANNNATDTTTTADNGVREEYVVQPGEYLSSIARKFNVSWLALAEVNNITDPDTVFAGMTLLIPNGSDVLSQNVSYATYNNIQPAASEPGARIGTGREIVVVLSTQMTYAYEDGVLKRSALVSTGLPATPTVQGDYKVWNKTRSQTMTGPGYALDNVEWVMYFHQGYGLHGTWWHNNFGQPMSHGCVNMTNEDAKWFYEFGSVGTPVHVRFY